MFVEALEKLGKLKAEASWLGTPHRNLPKKIKKPKVCCNICGNELDKEDLNNPDSAGNYCVDCN